MMLRLISFFFLLPTLFAHEGEHATTLEPPAEPRVEMQMYQDAQGTNLTGFYSQNPNIIEAPTIIIIPDWDGSTEYEWLRATLIADTTPYHAFVADIYGVLDVADDQRGVLAGLYRNQEPDLFMARIQAAVDHVKSTSSASVALVGYCFGGSGVLMYALGDPQVEAVVSFHGGLGPHVFDRLAVQSRQASLSSTSVLVISGGNDDASSDIMTLEETLDMANVTVNDWEITRFHGLRHGFTVWGSGAYDPWADERGWNSMLQFLAVRFGQTSLDYEHPDMEDWQEFAVPYVDETDGTAMQSYFIAPDATKWSLPAPTVFIIPDWDGVNKYELERAQMLADLGYAAMAVDIYGADKQSDLSFDERRSLVGFYTMDANGTDVFQSRMEKAIEIALTQDAVDPDSLAMIGYCFGGTGVMRYALSGREDVKLVAAFHGNVREEFLTGLTDTVPMPYTMVLSGGEDQAHGNQTYLESVLNDNAAEWEITRYSGVVHGFTVWDNANAYNLNADARSWTDMLTGIEAKVGKPMAAGEEEPAAPVDAPVEAPVEAPVDEAPVEAAGYSSVSMLTGVVTAIASLVL